MINKVTKMALLESAKGVKSVEVCKALKISQATYAATKTGRLIPSKKVQDLLADYYQLPFKELIQEADGKTVNGIVSLIKKNSGR